MKKFVSKLYWLPAAMIFMVPLQTFAADAPKKSDMNNPVIQVFVVVIILLALCIALLAHVLIGIAGFTLKKAEEEKKTGAKLLTVIAFTMVCSAASAADAPDAVAVKDSLIGGMSPTSFYGLLSVLITEFIILLTLLYNIRFLLKKQAAALVSVKEDKKINWLLLWDKFNRLRPIREEALIDLGHDYDGIRELDNRLPPWWLYGFYACIIFAMVYLWRYQVSHTGPSSFEEYTMAMQKGEEDKEAYLKTAANKVDENSVKLLTANDDLNAGKAIFTTVCAACHAPDGGGLVGPNLTDDYWLHGGKLKDIFKTIKYGWQEKGMKSWKEDYTPLQIEQLASYIKSLRGKKTLKPKEPQGVLFIETGKEAGDSTKKIDSTHLIPAVQKSMGAAIQ